MTLRMSFTGREGHDGSVSYWETWAEGEVGRGRVREREKQTCPCRYKAKSTEPNTRRVPPALASPHVLSSLHTSSTSRSHPPTCFT
ncbi:hypothetical protein E2C01_036862 [Portunus trituberculatus]|uniref:Uncharacterized protein n=1 Tax=Portunus trituberculatus TaxID=210409 RepID=A0A5B7F9U6_PORTR|nr:hypothetical protein [Portunus trituberculatus]